MHKHYGEDIEEATRLSGPSLERLRTEDVLRRYLPAPPASAARSDSDGGGAGGGAGDSRATVVDVLDVGGAAGVHALPLARRGYRVALLDPVERHVKQAAEASRAMVAEGAASGLVASVVGDARFLFQAWEPLRVDSSIEAVLMLGPLYHLQHEADRGVALAEAWRVLRPGGRVIVAGISRFASLMDGLNRGLVMDPVFRGIVTQDLVTGRHENPTNHPDYFTSAYLHRPDGLRREVADAGFDVDALIGVEGPMAYLKDRGAALEDDDVREYVLSTLRQIEEEPSIVGASLHMLCVAKKPDLDAADSAARAYVNYIAVQCARVAAVAAKSIVATDVTKVTVAEPVEVPVERLSVVVVASSAPEGSAVWDSAAPTDATEPWSALEETAGDPTVACLFGPCDKDGLAEAPRVAATDGGVAMLQLLAPGHDFAALATAGVRFRLLVRGIDRDGRIRENVAAAFVATAFGD